MKTRCKTWTILMSQKKSGTAHSLPTLTFRYSDIKRLTFVNKCQIKSYEYNNDLINGEKPHNTNLFFTEVLKWLKQIWLKSVAKTVEHFISKGNMQLIGNKNRKINILGLKLMLFRKRKIRDDLVETGLSSHIIKKLGEKGEQYKNIAQILDVQPPFITRVANGERNLTIEHLQKLAAHYGETLPLFLMAMLPEPKLGRKQEDKQTDKHARDYLQLCHNAQCFVEKQITGSSHKHAL